MNFDWGKTFGRFFIAWIINDDFFGLAVRIGRERADDACCGVFRECPVTLFKHTFHFNYPLSVLLYSGYSICYYIYNMKSIRKQHYEIERQIDEEMKEE